jgi:hypothetical protein
MGGKDHVQDLASLDAGELDRGLVGEILTAIEKALLLNCDAFALLGLFLDRYNRESSLDVKGVLAPGDGVDLDLHRASEVSASTPLTDV